MISRVTGTPTRVGRCARWLCARAVVEVVRCGLPRAAERLAALLFPESVPARIARGKDSRDRVVHVFDPFLHDGTGHYLSFDRAIHEQVEARPGWQARFYGRLDLGAEVGCALPAVPFFVKGARWGIRDRPPRSAESGDFSQTAQAESLRRSRRWIEFNRRRLEALDTACIRAGDVVMFPTLNTQSMSATIARWLRERPSVLVVMYFMLPDYAAPGEDGLSKDYAELFDSLAAHPRQSVVLLAETAEIRDDLLLRSKHRLPIEVAPHFKPERTLEELAHARRAAPPRVSPRVGYAGHARRDRGAHLVPEALRLLQERRPGTRLRVHVQDRVWCAMDLEALGRLSHLELRAGILELEDYYRYASGIDVMLLPFEPGPRTELQGSGVFWECLALGLVMVIPRDSHLEREARNWGAGFTTFSHWRPDAIATAALQAVEDYDRLAARARAAASKWRQEKSPSVFFDRILSLAGADGVSSPPRGD